MERLGPRVSSSHHRMAVVESNDSALGSDVEESQRVSWGHLSAAAGETIGSAPGSGDEATARVSGAHQLVTPSSGNEAPHACLVGIGVGRITVAVAALWVASPCSPRANIDVVASTLASPVHGVVGVTPDGMCAYPKHISSHEDLGPSMRIEALFSPEAQSPIVEEQQAQELIHNILITGSGGHVGPPSLGLVDSIPPFGERDDGAPVCLISPHVPLKEIDPPGLASPHTLSEVVPSPCTSNIPIRQDLQAISSQRRCSIVFSRRGKVCLIQNLSTPTTSQNFIKKITKPASTIVPVSAIQKRRKKTLPSSFVPRRSRCVAKLPPEPMGRRRLLCRQLGFMDEHEKVSGASLERYARVFDKPFDTRTY